VFAALLYMQLKGNNVIGSILRTVLSFFLEGWPGVIGLQQIDADLSLVVQCRLHATAPPNTALQ